MFRREVANAALVNRFFVHAHRPEVANLLLNRRNLVSQLFLRPEISHIIFPDDVVTKYCMDQLTN